MCNRNIVTNVAVEVNLSPVCGKALHLSKSRRHSWHFPFQVIHPYASPLMNVLACSLMCSLSHNDFRQLILKGNSFQGRRAQCFGAARARQLCAALDSLSVLPWLEADGGRALGQPASRWHTQGVLSALARRTGAKLSSSESILLWYFEACSKSAKEGIRPWLAVMCLQPQKAD